MFTVRGIPRVSIILNHRERFYSKANNNKARNSNRWIAKLISIRIRKLLTGPIIFKKLRKLAGNVQINYWNLNMHRKVQFPLCRVNGTFIQRTKWFDCYIIFVGFRLIFGWYSHRKSVQIRSISFMQSKFSVHGWNWDLFKGISGISEVGLFSRQTSLRTLL